MMTVVMVVEVVVLLLMLLMVLLMLLLLLGQSTKADIDVGQKCSETVLPILGAAVTAVAAAAAAVLALHSHLSELLLYVIHGGAVTAFWSASVWLNVNVVAAAGIATTASQTAQSARRKAEVVAVSAVHQMAAAAAAKTVRVMVGARIR